jgi:hypothetical protein
MDALRTRLQRSVAALSDPRETTFSPTFSGTGLVLAVLLPIGLWAIWWAIAATVAAP